MFGADRSVAIAYDAGEWRPSNWTIACVGTIHLLFAATLLTIEPPPIPPPTLNVVDVVTFPDGETAPVAPIQETQPVELKQARPNEVLPVPKMKLDQRLAPKLTDRRTKAEPIEKIAPSPPVPIIPAPPIAAPVPVPVPPRPAVAPQPVPVAASRPAPTPVPVPAQAPTPELKMAPEPAPVQIKPALSSPSLVQPDAQPLSISSAKLKLNQAPALKPLRPIELPTPAPVVADPRPVAPVASPQVAPIQAAPSPVRPAAPVARLPSPPPPAFTPVQAAPLTISKAKTPLPKVQLPRISAPDLRLPELSAGGEVASSPPSSPAAAPAGVTSMSGATPRNIGATGAPLPSASGSGSRAGAGGPNAGGPSGAPATSASGAPPVAGASGSGLGSGMLPRRPGGASVREAFPRGDSSTVLGRMDKTYDCSRLNRERDARCPNWDPIEGRNAQGLSGFEVPVPKGLPKLRNPIGTNPLPVCPPGTPGSQMGLSCLPTREGPGIPKQ